MVLSHEAAHIARRDALASLYIFVCHAAFFFHPAVWLVRHEWRTEREAACDQWAIDATGAAPQDYAAMLIKVSSGAERAPAFALSAVHTYRTLQRRISIMNKTNKKKSGRALVAAIAALLSIAALPFALVQRKTVPPNGVTGTIGPQVKVTQRRVDAGGPVATGAIAPTVVGGQAMAGPVVEGVPVAAGGIAATRIGGQATAGRSGPGAPVAVRATTVNGQAATGISAPQAANVSGVGTAQAARVTSVNGHVASGGTATAGPAQNETGVIAVPTGAPTNYSGEIAVASGPTQATSVTIVIKDRLSGQGTGLDHRVTLEMKEVEINAFIRSLAQASGVKIATKGVRSSMRLNVQIENATLGDVLGTVAKVYGLEWRVNDDGSITVQPFRPGTAR